MSIPEVDQSVFQGFLEAAPDAMVVVRKGGQIALVNRQIERVFGYRREEIIGKPIEVLVPARFRPGHDGHRNAYFSDPRTRPMGEGRDLFAVRKDGTEFPAEISLSPMETGNGRLIIAAVRDVTVRKRLEEKLREANRLKSEFLANMSHELRTPLNAVIGFAALMHQSKVGSVTADQKEYLGDILSSSRHLLRLINDVLDISKIESGKMEFSPEHFQLNGLMNEVRDVVKGIAAEKAILLDFAVSPGIDQVYLDPSKLKQVLLNYLSNAIKFTPNGGAVEARFSIESDTAYRIDVKDTGIGIRAEDLGRLFTEFAQLEDVGRRYGGTGLGLAVTKRIVEAQGGSVSVKSEYGKGSVFSALLPKVPSNREPR